MDSNLVQGEVSVMPKHAFRAASEILQGGGGLTAAESCRAAYPKVTPEHARKNVSRLIGERSVKAEIARMRAVAEKEAGSAVMTAMEKRIFAARVVRACVSKLPEHSGLWQSIKRTKDGVEYWFSDKLAAIKLDNDLAGEGSEAEVNDVLAALLARVMR